MVPGELALFTTRPLQLALITTRPIYNSPCLQVALFTTRPLLQINPEVLIFGLL